MNKILFTLIALFFSVAVFTSCSTKDDTTIDEEWKALNDKQVREAAATTSGYVARASISNNGYVYWKSFKFIPEIKTSSSPKITQEGTPYITDSVVVRYEGWYFLKDGTKHLFDTSEGEKNLPMRTRINSGLIDGFSTMLQYMRKGDQVQVCIPYQLAYGTGGTQGIPGYTTLWFNINLVDIIPDNPTEFK